jgi:hypothetical protein
MSQDTLAGITGIAIAIGIVALWWLSVNAWHLIVDRNNYIRQKNRVREDLMSGRSVAGKEMILGAIAQRDSDRAVRIAAIEELSDPHLLQYIIQAG